MKIRCLGWFGLICAGLLVWGIAWGEERKEMTPLDIPTIGDIDMLKVGDAAPQFSLEDLEGQAVSLGQPNGEKAHLLVFWSIFCEPCKAEMPMIQRLYEEHRDKGLEVVAIAMDGEPMKRSIQGLVKQQGYTFRVAIDKLEADESFVAADPYGVAGTPTVYIVGKNGKISFAKLGQTTKEALEKAIQGALAAK